MVSDAHAHSGGHSLLHHHFDDMEQQRESHTLGMWLFLVTELMMFGGLFFAYSLYRGMFPFAFEEGSKHLNIQLGTINTFVLLFSSLTMALAVHAAGSRNRQGLVLWLTVTFILGAAFLGIKAVEWGADFKEGLIPGVNWSFYHHPENQRSLEHLHSINVPVHQVMMYFVIYFCMTGLHAIHMIIGLGLVATFAFMGWKGKFTNGNDQPVEILGLYWHLIDIIWIFLFPLLYLIAGLIHGGGGH